MGKITSIIKISELIARKMSGQLDQQGNELLEEWLNCSKQNMDLYRKILDSGNLMERNKLYKSIDVEQAWNEVSGVLNVQGKKRFLIVMQKYAAAILIPVCMGITAYWYFKDQPHKDQLPKTDQYLSKIQHGTHNAVLVLNNGENINLASDSTRKLIENDGTVIKNVGEELSYEGQSAKKSKRTLLNTLIVPKGGEYSLVLSDGTRIFVNSMSKLVFPVKFSGQKREITLVEGEAYFEVAKNKSKPFIISVKGIQVEVLGTSFNIKAYPEDANSYTTLVEGSVKINPNDRPSNIQFLEPDQQAVFNPASDRIVINKVEAKQIVQWTTGKYSFTDEPLCEIMKTLSRWYDFDFKFEDELIKQIRFEGGLNKYESIDPILDIISKTGKVKVTVKGKEVIFSKI